MNTETLRHAISPEWLPWIAGLFGVVLGAATLEGLVRQFVLHQPYDWRAYAVSLADAVGRRAIDAIGLSAATPVLLWAYAHRLTDLPLNNWAQWLMLFLSHELLYYAYHRSAHRVRWFWATHAVHHSPNDLTLATALRLGWTGKLAGNAIFFVPLVWVGFSPIAVFATLAVNLLYQFWLHTTWVPKLGPLEWVFNTPSHHRVHHASNPEYLDCNYGGVLIVFDRLFGSFVEERDDITPRYGLTTPLRSYNPLWIAVHEWVRMAQDVIAARSWNDLQRALFAPPAVRSQAERATHQATPEEPALPGHWVAPPGGRSKATGGPILPQR
jgi:sterol desaturase/sphingolipid hydroxylase (fatty acid hydroxylase superfamily)